MGITHTHNSTYRADFPGEKNVRWRASFDFLPKSCGNDYMVFRGRMFRPENDFHLTKQHAIVKISKTKPMAAKDWEYYVRCTEEARKYSRMFNDIIRLHNLKIQIAFLRSCAAPVDSVSKITAKVLAKKYKRKFKSGEYVVIERFLYGKFQDFISVTGDILDKSIAILEAFSHYTYWKSFGELVVCSLKGVRSSVDRGADGEWEVLQLTSPCIHSVDGNYGPDDLGEEGMKLFFEQHKCNDICNSWDDFEILNRQRLMNNSLTTVDADVVEQTEVNQILLENKQNTKGSLHKEPIEHEIQNFDSIKSSPNGYIPQKLLSTDSMPIHTDENDSGCESVATDYVFTSNDSSTHIFQLSPDRIEYSPHSTKAETVKRAYVKFPVTGDESDHTELTLPKYVYPDCELMNPNTIVFQNNGTGTMKPIIKNGYARHDDIEIKIETPNTGIDSLDCQKKRKRVSWNVNVGPH